jgi:hypothetical protein
MLIFAPHGKPIITQFDYTRSKERAPILIDKTALLWLRTTYLDRHEWQIEQSLQELQYTDRAMNAKDLSRPMSLCAMS